MKGLFKVISFIVTHPIGKRNKTGSLKRFFGWQLSRLIFNYPVLYPFVEKTMLLISKGMKGATGNIYVGLHECEDMAFILHFLREDDRFIDVGANIGSYTILAAGVVGTPTITIEPVPSTFKTLINNIFLNNIEEKVIALNNGAGAEDGVLFFTTDSDTVNHVVLNPAAGQPAVKVNVTSLDAIIAAHFVPTCIKIDVEGFETAVLNGATQLLQNPALEAIIIELIGSGAAYGYDEKDIHKKLLANGFGAFSYEPFGRTLLPLNDENRHNNLLYLRDAEAVTKKVKAARNYTIMGIKI